MHFMIADNSSKCRSRDLGRSATEVGARQRFVHPGLPQTNGCVERDQKTILEECSRAASVR